eukprot:gnl/TRDRNA2_/TRDRNA2_91015_c0_seq1.p1 gnl/TRDRNA2_/TRDRNA2_91015_c0~~gnl/TRDRNA2_/TRDRNA2_91015_c0_seq1.p1  ORF type:complete len:555 (+),score=122.26 gnl/TRDRNA2_/TRDRNA2_91015_c0_seq1:82-1746(+)
MKRRRRAEKEVGSEVSSQPGLAEASRQKKHRGGGGVAETLPSVNASSGPPQKKKLKRKPELDAYSGDEFEDALAQSPVVAETQRRSLSSSPKMLSSGLFQTSTSFAKLGLARWLAESCERMGMRYPTDVQVLCIPPVLAGKNIVGNAKTGSGKTACYCLPTLHHLSKDPYGIFSLVLTPVRELAFQVADNFRALGGAIGVQVFEVVGGKDMLTQSKMISERRHVVVATPGRLADLLKGDPDLSEAFRRLRVFVLDEADRLLTPTFDEPLGTILERLPKTRQTLLFSATITRSIEKLRLDFGHASAKELLLLDANPKDDTLENLEQQYIFVPKVVQFCYLHYLLKEDFHEQSCIVFTPTIDMCQLLTTMLEILGLSVTGLHSLQSQRQRQACLGKFRAGRCKVLVATDVASRGLDIPKVAVVLNVGLPRETDDYVHRAGRTARAGRPGLVVSLMTESDVARVKAIEERLGKQLEILPTSEDDVLKLLPRTTKARQRAEVLLAEIGFEDKVAEHRAARKTQAPGAAMAAAEEPAPATVERKAGQKKKKSVKAKKKE